MSKAPEQQKVGVAKKFTVYLERRFIHTYGQTFEVEAETPAEASRLAKKLMNDVDIKDLEPNSIEYDGDHTEVSDPTGQTHDIHEFEDDEDDDTDPDDGK